MSVFDPIPTLIPLTEPERRRVEFAGGLPIVLPDGRPWRFFEPKPIKCTVRGESGEAEQIIAWNFGPGVDAETNDLLGRGFARVLAKIKRATNQKDRASGVLETVWYLLARNYVVSRDDFEDLLLGAATHGAIRRKRLFDALHGLVSASCERLRLMLENGES